MALSANTHIEVRSGGSDTANGGCFDGSQTAGMFTDGAATVANTASPVFTSVSYNFVAGDVGSWLYVASGASCVAGWYQIASVAANAATLSAAIGAGRLSVSSRDAGATTAVGIASIAGPGTITWSIDYSQQNAAQFSYTDLASAGAGLTVSSTATPFAKQMVGNGLIIASGTNFTAGVYVIASVAAGVATVVGAANITSGAGASGVGGLGGAFASPGKAGQIHVAGNLIFGKAATYTVTSASANVAGGCLSLTAGVTATGTKFLGYNSTRRDGSATRPLMQSDGVITTFTLVAVATACDVEGLNVDGNLRTSSRGFSIAAGGRVRNCKGVNCTNSAFSGTAGSLGSFCEATTCTTQPAFNLGVYFGCDSYANAIQGFGLGSNGSLAIFCISANNTGASGYGFGSITNGQCVNCVSYGNAQAGFQATAGATTAAFLNCVAALNGTYGFLALSTHDNVYLSNCATWNNATAATSGIAATNQSGMVVLTGDPFNNAAGLDFSQKTTGGGAQLKAAGIPGAYPAGMATTGYVDIGVQHQDTGTVTVSGGGSKMLTG